VHWYMGANERAVEQYRDHIIVALKSARTLTRLKPHLLYTGAPTAALETFAALGARIIPHDVPFLARLQAKKRIEARPHFKIEIASGAYLRTSVPLIEQSEEVVLYTDLDVMFRRDVEPFGFDKHFCASCESEIGDRSAFNSGVMFMNVPKLRASHAEFVAFMIERDFNFSAYDQGAYNGFYAQDWDYLPEEYNWKPYWGPSETARIIHFHGPKIWAVRRFCRGAPGPEVPAHHVPLYERNAGEYRRLLDEFEQWLRKG